MSLTPEEEERFQRFLKKRNVIDPEKIEEYRLGLILVREMIGEIPEHVKLSLEIRMKELKAMDEGFKNLGEDWSGSYEMS